jgi:putative flippase GtrA
MLKYGIVGLVGTFIHFAVLILLVELFSFQPVLSSALGFIIVVVASYYLNKKWTFKSNERTFPEFMRYLITSVSGLIMNIAIMYLAIDIIGLDYFIGQLLVTIVIPITNYFLNHYWTFKNL